MSEARYATFFGGPQHMERRKVPTDMLVVTVSTYDIKDLVDADEDSPIELPIRKGRYSRIHSVTGAPTEDFEWDGYYQKEGTNG